MNNLIPPTEYNPYGDGFSSEDRHWLVENGIDYRDFWFLAFMRSHSL